MLKIRLAVTKLVRNNQIEQHNPPCNILAYLVTKIAVYRINMPVFTAILSFLEQIIEH